MTRLRVSDFIDGLSRYLRNPFNGTRTRSD